MGGPAGMESGVTILGFFKVGLLGMLGIGTLLGGSGAGSGFLVSLLPRAFSGVLLRSGRGAIDGLMGALDGLMGALDGFRGAALGLGGGGRSSGGLLWLLSLPGWLI